ncbi:MAG: hypothetical protein V4510_07690 [bacterium]
MRNRTAVLLAFIMTASAALVVPTHAQAPPGTDLPATHMADDGLLDVDVCENGTCQKAPDGRWDPTDLKSLDVKETTDSFTFILGVKNLSPQPTELPGTESGQYGIYFQNYDRQFRLIVNRQHFAGTNYFGQLQAFDPGRNGYFTITSDPAELVFSEDLTANTVSATVAHRDLLADGNGGAPHPDVPFTGFHVTSKAINAQIGLGRGPTGGGKAPTPTASDAMPDNGNSTVNEGKLPIHFGVAQSGHARLRSAIPTRASNGEATTIVFQVQATNLAKSEDRFNLVTVGVPNVWQVKLPAAQLTIPGNGTLLFPILVTTPFAHAHGAFLNFVVELQSVSDPGSVGRVQLGVRYVNPPQPAGHHNQIWLHSTAASTDPTATVIESLFPGDTGLEGYVYMNALDPEHEPNDKKTLIPATLDCEETAATNTCGGANLAVTDLPKVHYAWDVPLEPALDMGLDFDTKGNGMLGGPAEISVHIKNALPMNGAVFSGKLVYYGAPPKGQGVNIDSPSANATVVATLEATTPVDVSAQNPDKEFKTVVHARPGGEFIPFQKGASLVLFLTLNFTRADPFFGPKDSPVLLPGGTFTLPLVEYHDPVQDIFLSTVELVATSEPNRFVNPGKTVLFNVTLTNHGDKQDTFLVEMTGTHAVGTADSWSRLIMQNPQVTIPAGGSVFLAVAVKAPDTAARPDAADLVLTATSQSDFNQRSLLHLYAVIDTDHPYLDEADQASALDAAAGNSGKTPGFELVALVAALGAAVLLLRRRQA